MKRFDIVLVEPQIPQNTGNIGRLCVASGSFLHLIHPLGFSTHQKDIKRAGLDYWQHLCVKEYENLQVFSQHYVVDKRHFFLSSKAKRHIYEADLSNGGFLYFGREDKGLDEALLSQYEQQCYKLPMISGIRCINLATSVGAVLYEGIRQSRIYTQW